MGFQTIPRTITLCYVACPLVKYSKQLVDSECSLRRFFEPTQDDHEYDVHRNGWFCAEQGI